MKVCKWLLMAVLSVYAHASYIPATTIFQDAHYRNLTLSPDGQHVAFIYHRDENFRIAFWDAPSAKKKLAIFNKEAEFTDIVLTKLDWLSDDIVMATTFSGNKYLVDARRSAQTPSVYYFTGRNAKAYSLIHALPDSPEEFIAVYHRDDGMLEAYRMRIDFKGGFFKRIERLDGGISDAVLLGSDADGRIRIAAKLSKDESSLIFFTRDVGRTTWQQTFSLPIDKDENITPAKLADQFKVVSLSNDGYIYFLSNYGEEHKTLKRIRYGMDTPEVVYQSPGRDIVDVEVDPKTQTPISVVTIENGLPTERPLSDTSYSEDVQKLLSNYLVVNHLGRRYILIGLNGKDRLKYFYYDDQTKALHYIHPVNEDLKPYSLSIAKTFKVKASDGMLIEAYLSLPGKTTDNKKYPLVVMPHGGPMWVRDLNVFDPMVEYLASRGIAVLRVNFRGSGGFGRSFLLAGRGQFGQAIENDIELARRYAVRHFPIDKNRQCIMGASYGGYSALRSVMLHPKTYRCAIARFPVTDLPLLFNDTTIGSRKKRQKAIEAVLGEKESLKDKWLELSPDYHPERIHVPVLLTGGYLDTTTTIEHLRRMAYALEKHKKPFTAIMFPESKHGHKFWRDDHLEVVVIFGFLAKHLKLRANNTEDFKIQSAEFVKAGERLKKWKDGFLLGIPAKAYLDIPLRVTSSDQQSDVSVINL
ncbi:MAG: S9 family peptidase [Gammaproteobacteria bacterium]|nr:MAG: S9 family peptidase [Gammaproteobacteria bacterium]